MAGRVARGAAVRRLSGFSFLFCRRPRRRGREGSYATLRAVDTRARAAPAPPLPPAAWPPSRLANDSPHTDLFYPSTTEGRPVGLWSRAEAKEGEREGRDVVWCGVFFCFFF